MENALRHTPAGTIINVRLTDEDDGPGVLPEDLPHLTDRFYRGEQSRTTPGNGLGLSLVHAVADLHRARLDIEPLNPGLRVNLAFAQSTARRGRDATGSSVAIPVGEGTRR